MIEFKDKYFPVLDHGFCALVDYMGDDTAITRAARCSYGAGNRSVSDDRGLIRTLIREKHTSPFEMCEVVLHVGLPIFVARQWIRHRTASLNEYSGRYSIMPSIYYTPDNDRLQVQHAKNKQGSGPVCIDEDAKTEISTRRDALRHFITNHYNQCLEFDLARELSRIDLPLSTYTFWYWKIDLKNLLHFLRLRLDQHAQWEIQQYAKVIAGLVAKWVPLTWEAFVDYELCSTTFSRPELKILDILFYAQELDIGTLTNEHMYYIRGLCDKNGLTGREQDTFIEKLKCQPDLPAHIELDVNNAKTPEFYQQMINQGVV
jgi:thymidylate synthase (FAD)